MAAPSNQRHDLTPVFSTHVTPLSVHTGVVHGGSGSSVVKADPHLRRRLVVGPCRCCDDCCVPCSDGSALSSLHLVRCSVHPHGLVEDAEASKGRARLMLSHRCPIYNSRDPKSTSGDSAHSDAYLHLGSCPASQIKPTTASKEGWVIVRTFPETPTLFSDGADMKEMAGALGLTAPNVLDCRPAWGFSSRSRMKGIVQDGGRECPPPRLRHG